MMTGERTPTTRNAHDRNDNTPSTVWGNPQSGGSKDVAIRGGTERLNARECASYIAQLRAVLDAATSEPPAGVDTATVEHRIALVQTALVEVERRNEELRREREAKQNQKFIDTQRRRTEAEVQAERARVTEDKHRQEVVNEMRDLQIAYYRDRNDKTEEKAIKCREHNIKVNIDTMAKAGSNEGQRQKKFDNLMEEREREVQELRERGAERQEYTRAVNRRRAAERERDRLEKEEQARAHDQEVQAKLAAMRESRRSKWVAKREASRAKSLVVFKNGKAVLETQVMNHEQLVKELTEKERGQQERYATERAEREYLQQMRSQYRAMQQDRQQQNLIKVIDNRLARGEEIVKEAHEKMERGDITKEAQGLQYREAGKELRKDLCEHQDRAALLEHERQNNTLNKNYRRWNFRAARIIAELQEAMDEHEQQQQQQQQRQSAVYRRYADEEDTTHAAKHSRAPRLPSPSDFAT